MALVKDARRHIVPMAQDNEPVMRSQLRFAGATAAVLLIQVVAANTPVAVSDRILLIALLAVPVVTVIVVVLPWDAIDPRWTLAVPLANLVSIEALRVAAPVAGFGFLLPFPVVWLSLSFGRVGARIGVLAALTCVWGQLVLQTYTSVIPGPIPAVSVVTSLTVTILFLAAIISASERRITAQRRLLAGQADMLDDARRQVVGEQQSLTAVLDEIPFTVITYSATGDPLHANGAAVHLLERFGLDPHTPAHRLPIYGPDGVTPVPAEQLIDRALRGEPVASTIYWLGHPGNDRIALDVRADPLPPLAGIQGAAIVVARDVTAELALTEARDEATASTSHEFRTPLSSVLGYLDLVHDDPSTTPVSRDHLATAIRNTERLLHLVDDLLSSRSAPGDAGLDLTISEADVSAVVREAVAGQYTQARDRMITLRSQSAGPALLSCDPLRLRQVFDNLISNAVKYDRPGGTVVAQVEPSGDHVVITVTDTGHGMAAEEVDQLFRRYYRTADARASDSPGTGLGLSIARDIVNRHDGTLEVHSQPDVGTTVTVRLPRPPKPGVTA